VRPRRRLAVLLVVAAVPRFAWLTRPYATFDETWSWYLVDLIHRAGAFWHPVGIGMDAPLFVAVNLATTRWLGHETIAPLRFPPAVFGTLSVPLFYAVVRRLGTERLAWRAALLTAVSPFFVFYGKDARPYAQLLFTSLLFTWAYVATEGTRRRWGRRVLLAALAACAVASHYYALTYLAAFYSLQAWRHWRADDRAATRDVLVTGAVGLVVLTPLLLVFALSVSRITVPYWRVPSLNFVSVVAEQFLFTGVAATSDDPNATLLMWLQIAVVVLLIVPTWVRWWRETAAPPLHPVLGALWWWTPGLVQLHDLVGSRAAMFFPRGFIASAPFLLPWWLHQCDAMPVRAWLRRTYMVAMLAPVLVSGWWTATCDPRHAMYRNREAVAEVAAQMRTLEGQFDVAIVHLWWAAQCVAYYYRGAAPVQGLGLDLRELAVQQGDLAAALASLRALRPTDRVLLVENDLATDHVDPDERVRAVLRATRPVLAEVPCHPTLEREIGFLCRHMLLYGPARSTLLHRPGG
jgi:hypothetical protein